MASETASKTSPDEWERWITKEAFNIGIEAYKMSGGNFGSPMLFGLADDLATHHANSLMFWSNSSKDESMARVRDIVKSQKLTACAILTRSEIRKKDTTKPAMVLVIKKFGQPATMVVREILPNAELSAEEVFLDVEGRLTKFWDDPSSA